MRFVLQIIGRVYSPIRLRAAESVGVYGVNCSSVRFVLPLALNKS
jgi:hypothetical protein